MSRWLKSRDYFVKCLGFVLLFGFISLGAIGGCGNNGGEQDGTQALTERDFFNNLNLFANPEDGVVAVFLESVEALEAVNLTGDLGFDVIPYRYTRTLNHTFCFEDDNDDSVHSMILLNSDGEEVLMAQANGDCVTEVIEAGDYEVVLNHGEHVNEQETVFLIPAPEEEQIAKREQLDQKEIKTANGFSYKIHRYLPGGLVKFIESISNVFTHPARAQGTETPSANITTLLSTNACVKCNLMNVDLSNANLSNANLMNANLMNANLTLAILSGANLSGAILFVANVSRANLGSANLSNASLAAANLTNADLTLANLNEANLTDANLTDANLNEATLINANMQFANLNEANLNEANLTQAFLLGTILTGTILTGAILTGAIWCDGCECANPSIDICVGCASQDTCTGPGGS